MRIVYRFTKYSDVLTLVSTSVTVVLWSDLVIWNAASGEEEEVLRSENMH